MVTYHLWNQHILMWSNMVRSLKTKNRNIKDVHLQAPEEAFVRKATVFHVLHGTNFHALQCENR